MSKATSTVGPSANQSAPAAGSGARTPVTASTSTSTGAASTGAAAARPATASAAATLSPATPVGAAVSSASSPATSAGVNSNTPRPTFVPPKPMAQPVAEIDFTLVSKNPSMISTKQRPAFDALNFYLQRARDAVYVSLQGYNIDDLTVYIGGLRQLSNLRTLSVAHNQLERLPEDLSFMLSLESLDLTGNRFTKASSVLKGLFSIPNLKHLKVILPEEEEEQIVATLPLLETLNGVQLVDPEAEAEAMRKAGEDAELDDAEAMMDPQEELRRFKQAGGYPTRAEIGKNYGFVPWTTEHSNDFRRAFEDSARAGGSLASGSHEFEELHRAVVTHMRARYRSEPDIVKAQTSKLNGSCILMEFCFDEAVRSATRYNKDLAQALRTMCDKNSEILSLASAIVAATQDDKQERFLAMQADVQRMAKEIDRLRRVNIDVEKRAAATVAASAGGAASAAGGADDKALGPAEKDFVRDIFSSFKSSTATLSELKNTIREIFVSKQKQDALHLKSRLPRETLEQHVFSYFVNRQAVGNRDTVRATVEGFFKSVYAQKSVDLDISVFDQIVNCELDEGYWYEHQKLNATVYDAIYSALLADGQRTSRDAADGVDGFLDEQMCKRILSILIPDSPTSQSTTSAVMRATIIEMRRTFDPSTDRTPKIGYQAFARFVLMSYVAQRKRAIEPVVAALHAADTDRTGVFDHAQLRSVMEKVIAGVMPREQHYVTQVLDPNGHQIILFSDIVRELCGLNPAKPGSGALPSIESQRKERRGSNTDAFRDTVREELHKQQ